MDWTQQDRDMLRDMSLRIERVEQEQAGTARAIRLVPRRTAKRISSTVSKRAAVFIGIGVLIGNLLGGAASPVLAKLIATLFGLNH